MYPSNIQGRTILLVEDNQTTRLLLESYLAELEVEVRAVPTAQSALAVLAEQEISLLLVDLGLPDLPGFELIGRTLRIQPQVKVVVFTADEHPETVVRAIRLGAVDFLTKPVRQEQLLYAVKRAIRTPIPSSLSLPGPSPIEHLNTEWKAARQSSAHPIPWKHLVDLQCLPFAVATAERLVRANKSFAQQFGITEELRKGAPLAEIFGADDLEPIQALVRQSIDANRLISRVIPWFGRLDSVEWYKVDVAPCDGLGDCCAPCCSMVVQNQSLLVSAESSIAKLTQQMLLARDEERRFLSQELHDTVAQDLGLIRLHLSEAFRRRTDQEDWIEQMRELSENALTQLRFLLQDSREALSNTLEFHGHLETHCKRYLKDIQVEIDPQINQLVQKIEEPARFDCLRVLQETIRNTAHHAHASFFAIRGKLDQKWVVIEAIDDGVGLTNSPPVRGREDRGFGLIIMRERLARWGGEIRSVTVPKGTVWQLRLPSLFMKTDVEII